MPSHLLLYLASFAATYVVLLEVLQFTLEPSGIQLPQWLMDRNSTVLSWAYLMLAVGFVAEVA